MLIVSSKLKELHCVFQWQSKWSQVNKLLTINQHIQIKYPKLKITYLFRMYHYFWKHVQKGGHNY